MLLLVSGYGLNENNLGRLVADKLVEVLADELRVRWYLPWIGCVFAFIAVD